MQTAQKIALVFFLLLLLQPCFAIDLEATANVKSVKTNVVIEGEGEISGNLMGRTAEVEVLSFKETQNQAVTNLKETLEINGKTISAGRKQDEWGNSYASFKVSETGKFTYRIEATVETNVQFPALQDFDLSKEIGGFPEYSNPTENIESNHETVRTVAFNLFKSDSWLDTVVEVTKWSYDSIEYDLDYFPEVYSAVETLNEKKGVCDEFAVVTAAILRAKGIPTRVITGLSYNPQETIWRGHAWLEAFNPETGWVSIDSTFGQAGVVDGTHIMRGIFPDPGQSNVARVRAVQTVSINVQENMADVEIVSFENFSGIFSMQAEDIVIPTNQWHEIKATAKNNLNGNVIGWFSLVLPNEFSVQDHKKMILFGPGEEKELVWNIRVDKELEENEYLLGNYRIIGLGTDLKKQLKAMPSPNFVEDAKIRVVGIVPLVEGRNMVIEIKLENIGEKEGVVEIRVNDSATSISLGGFESRVAKIEIQEFQDIPYNISIKGPGIGYQTSITVHEGIPFTNAPTSTQQPGNKVAEQVAGILFTMETGVLVGIVLGLAFIVVLLKELLSR